MCVLFFLLIHHRFANRACLTWINQRGSIRRIVFVFVAFHAMWNLLRFQRGKTHHDLASSSSSLGTACICLFTKWTPSGSRRYMCLCAMCAFSCICMHEHPRSFVAHYYRLHHSFNCACVRPENRLTHKLIKCECSLAIRSSCSYIHNQNAWID